MFNEYFDKIYLINLSKRKDRLKRCALEFDKFGIEAYRWNAVNSDSENFFWKRNNTREEKRIGWTKGAAALCYTTIEIIEDAIKNNYRSILILEDDVYFKEFSPHYVNSLMKKIPKDWEMINFGYQDVRESYLINESVRKTTGSLYCHCYGVKNSVYKNYLTELKNIDKPIDIITCEKIHSRGKSYSPSINVAFQHSDYSNIREKNVSHLNLYL